MKPETRNLKLENRPETGNLKPEGRPETGNLKPETSGLKSQVSALIFLFLPLLLTGCVAWSVPRTTIDGSIGGQPFHFSGPKDVTLGALEITAKTNGTISISLTNLTARMNPDVITTTGAAQAAMIAELFKGIQGLMAAAPAGVMAEHPVLSAPPSPLSVQSMTNTTITTTTTTTKP